MSIIQVPQISTNEEKAILIEWFVDDGSFVRIGDPLFTLELSKVATDIDAEENGFLEQIVHEDTVVTVGQIVGKIHPDSKDSRSQIKDLQPEVIKENKNDICVVTKKAAVLMKENDLNIGDFPKQGIIRSEDVNCLLFRNINLQKIKNSNSPCNTSQYMSNTDIDKLKNQLNILHRQMREKYDRHVPTGTLLNDRWNQASDYGFGRGTSMYDEALILGNVQVGENTWIGPFSVLDGSGGELSIGSFVSIGSGCQVYTHDSIKWALTGGNASFSKKMTSVGDCCFIAPMSIIGPGTIIGNHCFVTAGSFVNGEFDSNSIISGSPAKRVGKIRIKGKNVSFQYDKEE